MSLFQNALASYRLGQSDGRATQQRNALLKAGQFAQAGDWKSGAGALYGAGMIDQGLGFESEARDNDQRGLRRTIGGMAASGNFQGAANTAFGAGDLDMGVQLQDRLSKMSEENRRKASLQVTGLAHASEILRGMPTVEQRMQAAPEVLRGLAGQYNLDVDSLVPQMTAERLSDQALQAAVNAGLSIGDIRDIRKEDTDRTNRERLDAAFGAAIGLKGDARVRAIAGAGVPGAGTAAFELQRELEEQQQRNAQFYADLNARREARLEGQQPKLTTGQATNIRNGFATAQQLEQTADQFIQMVKGASPTALAGVGPDGAALMSAHNILALAAKGPAALDLGALIGPDFEILYNILGKPGDIRALAQNGGKDGIIARLEEFKRYTAMAQARLRVTHAPYADNPLISDFFKTPAALSAYRTPGGMMVSPIGSAPNPEASVMSVEQLLALADRYE